MGYSTCPSFNTLGMSFSSFFNFLNRKWSFPSFKEILSAISLAKKLILIPNSSSEELKKNNIYTKFLLKCCVGFIAVFSKLEAPLNMLLNFCPVITLQWHNVLIFWQNGLFLLVRNDFFFFFYLFEYYTTCLVYKQDWTLYPLLDLQHRSICCQSISPPTLFFLSLFELEWLVFMPQTRST